MYGCKLSISQWTLSSPGGGQLAGLCCRGDTSGSQMRGHVGGQQPGVPCVRVRRNFLLAIAHVVVSRIKVLLAALMTKRRHPKMNTELHQQWDCCCLGCVSCRPLMYSNTCCVNSRQQLIIVTNQRAPHFLFSEHSAPLPLSPYLSLSPPSKPVLIIGK